MSRSTKSFSFFGKQPPAANVPLTPRDFGENAETRKKKGNLQAKKLELKAMRNFYKLSYQSLANVSKINADLVSAEANYSAHLLQLPEILDKDDPKVVDLRNLSKNMGDQLKKIAALRHSLNDNAEKNMLERTKCLHDDYKKRERAKSYEVELDFHLARRNIEYLESLTSFSNAYLTYFETGAAYMKEMQDQLKNLTEKCKKTPKPNKAAFTKSAMDAVAAAQHSPSNGPPSPLPAPSLATKIFNMPLSLVLSRPTEPGPVPIILDKMCKFIEANGLRLEGIFRISGQVSDINKLKSDIDFGLEVSLENYTVHTICGLTKSYIRELPEPLLTFDLFEAFIGVARMSPGDQQNAKIWEICQKLPKDNYNTLARVVQMFRTVVDNYETTKMSAGNLSIAFGMNLMQMREENPTKLMQVAGSINKVCELLIINCQTLFPEKIVLIPKSLDSELDNDISEDENTFDEIDNSAAASGNPAPQLVSSNHLYQLKLGELTQRYQAQVELVSQMKQQENTPQFNPDEYAKQLQRLTELETLTRDSRQQQQPPPSSPTTQHSTLPQVQPPQQAKPQVQAKRSSLNGWVEILDKNRNRFYYHNPETKETSWFHPRDNPALKG